MSDAIPEALREAVTFIEGLIKAEFEARCAAYDEPDDARYDAIVAAASAWYDAGIAGPANPPEHLSRPLGPDAFGDNPFAADMAAFMGLGTSTDREAERAALRPATFFRVSMHVHPERGDLLRFDLEAGQGMVDPPAAGRLFFAWRGADGLRVRSVYAPCRACKTRGVVDFEPCGECEGRGWKHRAGEALENPGPVIAAHVAVDCG